MPRNLFTFRWVRYPGHYRWVDDPIPLSDRNLVDGKNTKLSSRFPTSILSHLTECSTTRSYEPLRSAPGLFRIFAETEPTKEGILAFADKFGTLTEGVFIIIESASEKELQAAGLPCGPTFREGRIGSLKGEYLHRWRYEILEMRDAVFLWDLIRTPDDAALRAHVSWIPTRKSGEFAVAFRLDRKTPWPDTLGSQKGIESLALIPPPPAATPYSLGELKLPVVEYLADAINSHLKEDVSPRIGWDRDLGRLALSFVPSTLLGAMWLQFAQAANANADYRECENCGRMFEVSRTAARSARSDRLFCTDACKSKAYRGRKGRAREMFAAGKSMKEIAAELGSTAQQVKKWVSSQKG